ncbi:NAD(P)-binding domain-containing protein [Lutimaribacter sp. EGI FJ00015]|uniref:NAD(P)-binding domain-containing protein n=1 Tax=Lutimaribacter degradans TaxID=2945989 RepID=A0ACC5ZTB3_9RHOB|nr:NAD(P)-binding domain-containing protein [Lutimaribacter sp. EGI FJ00013]MCM2561183.1 NAD(P)-binding domain-containing protein [Lutimaribacter sp. EGI FJ00013]MCO0611868.1 NAD(P)-binding domain-containing protein [Lutimaribacter sp. EGI FJ00015]MCO0635011.1 NAD(P)-binding domain-containing protein [Lutimaribacter sp. EGI FJ00014]
MTSKPTPIDCLIIGAGAAGLQAAYFLDKKGLGFHVLERGQVGQFFRDFPRQRNLISINKVHTGLSNPDTRLRFDWNSLLNDEGDLVTTRSRRYFPTADEFVDYLGDFSQRFADRISCGVTVTRIAKPDETFLVETDDGQVWRARTVIVATGMTKPWQAEIDGIEHVENYFDYDSTKTRFRDKRVAILGKGNSAFETAESLIEEAQSIHVISPNSIKLAWNSHFVGHLRAVNTNFLDTYQLKSQNAVVDGTITRIVPENGGYTLHIAMSAAEGHEIVLHYDHVIACTGFRFDDQILDPAIRPDLRHMGKFPAMTAQWETETAAGLYFAGTLMQSRDFKKTMSGFVHGFRYNIRCLVEFVAARLTGAAYPHATAPLDAQALGALLIDRFSTASGIFLQPGFLGDVVVLDGPDAGAIYTDVPVDWTDDAPGFAGRTLLRATLEFGNFGANSMHVKREHTLDGSTPDPFIHPVLRLVRDGEVLAQTHLSDHLDSDWRAPAAKDAGNGTVQRMTYVDAGQTLPGHEVAQRQIAAFFAAQGLFSDAPQAIPAQ